MIWNNTPHNLTGHESTKFNKHLDKVNDYRNEIGEIWLLLNETYDEHKVRHKGRETDSDGSISDTSSSDSDASTYLSREHARQIHTGFNEYASTVPIEEIACT